uniref:Transmembrane protein n=1 Tax=Medicago truncatula TaxID=3880 RepID=I3SLA0_MEDTR|nr:unknown [Medicago truncatula]
MRGFVGMDLIMIILNEKQGWLLCFFFIQFLVWNYLVSIIKI